MSAHADLAIVAIRAAVRFEGSDFTRIREGEPVAERNHDGDHAEEDAPADRRSPERVHNRHGEHVDEHGTHIGDGHAEDVELRLFTGIGGQQRGERGIRNVHGRIGHVDDRIHGPRIDHAGRRVAERVEEEEQERNAVGDAAEQHPRAGLAPTGLGLVDQNADGQIPEGHHQTHDEQHGGDHGRREPDHIRIEHGQIGGHGDVADGRPEIAHTEGEFRQERQFALGFDGCRHSSSLMSLFVR